MRRKNILALLLALLLTAGQITPALAADTAAVMKLSATEGTVTVCNSSARTLTVKDDMRLYNGYTVETTAKSYAWINLDDSKLVKLDASTKVEIRKSGKKLEVLVNSGNIYGDVSKKLDSDETLNIRTSTAVVGIRGTKFQVGVYAEPRDSGSGHISGSETASNGQTVVTCMEGSVTLTTLESGDGSETSDPGTGEPSPGTETSATETQTVIVSAGQTATVSSTPSGTESNATDISVSLESMQQSDLTGSTQTELTSQGNYTVTPPGGEPITLTPDGAAAQKAADQQAAQQKAAENARPAQTQTPAQGGTAQEVTKPVWDSNTSNTDSSGSSDSGSSGSGSSTGNSGSGSSGSGSSAGSSGSGSSGSGSSAGSSGSGSSGSGSSAGSSGSGSSGSGSSGNTGGSGGNSGSGSTTPSTPDTPTVTTYTVTFDANGGVFYLTASTAETTQIVQTVEANKLPSTPTSPDRKGYAFTGWYTDRSCTNSYSFNTPVTANITVYAGWRPTEHSVFYDGNGGTFDGGFPSNTVITEHGQPVSDPPVPVRDGYSFVGWYTDSACTTAYDLDANVTSDLALYAKWIEDTKTYTATFVSNGGSAVDSKTIVEGEVFTPPSPPWWDYHTFGGWYTDQQCTTEYTFSSEASSDITLYAKWTDGVTITFDPDGGNFADGTSEPRSGVTDVQGKLIPPLPELPEMDGYLCTGWYRGTDLVDDEYDGTFKEAETLYAHWAKPYTVTFDRNDGSAVETQTVIEGGKATKPADPTRDGYTFDSWYQDAACSYSKEWDFDKSTVDNNITLYAKWFGHDETLSLTSSDEANLDMLDRLMKADACQTIELSAGDSTKLALGNQDLQIPAGKTLIVKAEIVVSGHISVNGNLNMIGGEIYQGVTVEDGGTLNLLNGTVSGGVILNDSGKLNMSDGKITNSATSAAALTVKGTADGTDGNVNAKISGGKIDGGDGVALLMISGSVSDGGYFVADQLKNVLQVGESAGTWSISGMCDNNTSRELYLGRAEGSSYALNWIGPWSYNKYGFESGAYGTEAALVADCSGSIKFDLGNELNLDLNGKRLTLESSDSLTVGVYSVLLKDSTGGGKFIVSTNTINLGSGTIKANQDGIIVLTTNVTGYQVMKSGNYWELRQG